MFHAEHAANQRIMLYYKDAVMFPMFWGIMLKSANGINEGLFRGKFYLNSIGHLQRSGLGENLGYSATPKKKGKGTVYIYSGLA